MFIEALSNQSPKPTLESVVALRGRSYDSALGSTVSVQMKVTLREAEKCERSFAYEVKKQALGPHVRVKWGWDESFQSKIHAQRWHEKNWFIIEKEEKRIGTCTIDYAPQSVRFGEFYLTPNEQGKGIGACLLQQLLDEWDSKGCRVYLEHLKWNPVGNLYRRLGFKDLNESDVHYNLVREPNAH